MGGACSENRKLRDFSLGQWAIKYICLVALPFSSHSSASSSSCSHLPSLGWPLGRQLVLFVLSKACSLNHYCVLSCLFVMGMSWFRNSYSLCKVVNSQENSGSPKTAFCFHHKDNPVIWTSSVNFHLPTDLWPVHGTVPAWELGFKYPQITHVKDDSSVLPFRCWADVSNFIEIISPWKYSYKRKDFTGYKINKNHQGFPNYFNVWPFPLPWPLFRVEN